MNQNLACFCSGIHLCLNLTASLQSSGQDGGRGGGQDGTRVMVSFAPLQHRELLEDATVRILLSLVTSPSASMVKPKLPVVPREGRLRQSIEAFSFICKYSVKVLPASWTTVKKQPLQLT